MLHLIVAYAFLIQSYRAADITWIGTEPLSISLGDYSFFGLTGASIYEFDGSSVITVFEVLKNLSFTSFLAQC